MSKSHIHQFSYSNINKSSPLTYLGRNFYFLCLWEIYPFLTWWAILLLEKLLPYETSKWGIGFPLLWMIFRILIGHLHDDVVLLLRLESFRVLLSCAN